MDTLVNRLKLVTPSRIFLQGVSGSICSSELAVEAIDEIEQLRKSLSDTLDALDHAIYLVGPDANQIKGMTGAAERARELLK
jgi:hypothetical protein